jgi:hypothetical protein
MLKKQLEMKKTKKNAKKQLEAIKRVYKREFG